MTARKRVAILISGRGSNMAALIDAAASPDFPAEIVGVISNRADAKGLAIAAAKGVSTQVIPSKGIPREEHDAALDKALDGMKAEIVCLAGYLRLLTDGFVARWSGSLINIHPALLPAFPGVDAQAQAIAYGVRVAGCTVHFVDPGVDTGPIIAQAAVEVEDGDDRDKLALKILEKEHELLVRVISWIAEGRVRIVEGEPGGRRRVVVRSG